MELESQYFQFYFHEQNGCKIPSQTETVHHKKINESLCNSITFYLENDNNEEVDFKGETLTFTLQMTKV